MSTTFSSSERVSILAGLGGQEFDLIVVGGGITGAGIFRDAVMRGLRVLLVEREDFASGTSSKSSKLVHGGLRYLERFHIRLTRESVRERELLLRLNPHLVRSMPFLFPIYRSGRLHPLFIRMGLRFYEYLSGGTAIPHRMLRPEQLGEFAPTMHTDDLRRIALYYDSTVDDARLVSENILDGVGRGGTALNYVSCTDFLRDGEQLCGVVLEDQEGDTRVEVRAAQVVNATGIHVDTLRGKLQTLEASELRASKGVHLVLPRNRIPLECTAAFMNPADGRLMFAIPWGETVMVGTTDTFDQGDVRVTDAADLHYVLEAINSTFVGEPLTETDVICTLAGVRTLVVSPGKGEENASAVSREHAVYEDPSGLVSIAGGKLTTFRIMAMDIVDLLVKRFPEERRAELGACSTDTEPLGGAVEVEPKAAELQEAFGVDEVVAAQLVRSYGARAHEPLEQAGEDRSLLQPIAPGAAYLRAEISYLCRHEAVVHLDDLLTRRLRVALFVTGQALEQAADLAALAGAELGWDAARQGAEVERYRKVVAEEFRPVAS